MQNNLNPQELTPEQQIEQLKILVSELQDTTNQQAQVIEEQAKALETVSPPSTIIMEVKSKIRTVPSEPVNVGDKDYMFLVPCFRITGEPDIVLSENAALRPDLLQKIIAIKGQGILKEVV